MLGDSLTHDLPVQSSPEISELVSEVHELRKLFHRRLLEDRPRNEFLRSVQTSLQARDALDTGRVFAELFRELLLAVDRLAAHDPAVELNESISVELLGIMSRRGLQRINTSGGLDLAVHEVVEAEAGAAVREGAPVRVLREGYTLAGQVLRPARVKVQQG